MTPKFTTLSASRILVLTAVFAAALAPLSSAQPSRGPTPPDAPLPESPPMRKPRYISLTPGNPGKQIALRITLADIKLAAQVNGQVRWAGSPQLYNDGSLPQFWAAKDQCTSHYQDWSTIPVVHLYGRDVAAGSLYAVQSIEQGMDENDEANYSSPLLLTTSNQGDSVGVFDGTSWTPPDALVTFHDMLAGIECFTSTPGRITKVRCQQGYPEPNPAFPPNFGEMVGVYEPFVGNDATRSPLDCGQSPLFVCGNGTLEPGETCDDGDTFAGDGCDPHCLLEPTCGNDYLDPGERCDDANATNGDGCSSVCLVESVCGNGTVEPEFEECDDGGTAPGDGCDAQCRWETRTAVIKLTPVQPTGTSSPPYPPGTTINGQEIRLYHSSKNVWLEFTVAGWDPNADEVPSLKAMQLQFADGTFASGGTSLRRAAVPCANSAGCTSAVGSGSQCQASFCQAGFLMNGREDNVAADVSSLFAPDFFPADIRFGLASFSAGMVDEGIEHYAGSLVLEVPPGASGTYNIGLASELTSTFLVDTTWAQVPIASVVEGVITVDLRKNRYLTLGAPIDYGVGQPLGARIKLVSLPQFPASNGEIRWAGPIAPQPESPSGGTLSTGELQCTPTLQMLAGLGEIQVHGREIVPGSTYEVRYATAACIALGQESCMSNPITLTTSKWGDVWLPFDASQPNFLDISVIVDKFKDLPGAHSKSRLQLYGDDVDPSVSVNFLDISACVSAFKGQPYPHAGPGSCP